MNKFDREVMIPMPKLSRNGYKGKSRPKAADFSKRSVHISLTVEKLGNENCSAGGTAKGVVRHTDKLVVKERILAQTSAGDAHSAVDLAVELDLGTRIVIKISDELLGS